MAELVGFTALQRRFSAVQGAPLGEAIMKFAAQQTIGQLTRGQVGVGAYRTGLHSSRLLKVSSVTATTARVVGPQLLLWLDEGTGLFGPRHQRIVPTSKKALAWTGGPRSAFTLTGRVRSGKAGAGAGKIVRRSTAGMKPRPFISASIARAAVEVQAHVGQQIITAWNEAA